jgi:WD40 repeat protein
MATDDIRTMAILDALARKEVWIAPLAMSGAVALGLGLFLWTASSPDEAETTDALKEASEISTVRCLSQAHTLDVFLLASGARRFLVSVGFDHEVRLWDLESPTVSSLLIPCGPEHGIFWPVNMVSIDNRAEWIAVCSQNGTVTLWNRETQRFGVSTKADARIVACVFARMPGQDRFQIPTTTRLLLVLETGSLIDLNVDTGSVRHAQICNCRVRSAHIGSSPRMPTRLITITEADGIFTSVNRDGWWSTQPLQFAALDFASPVPREPLRFSVIPSLRGVGVAYQEYKSNLHLVDMLSG